MMEAVLSGQAGIALLMRADEFSSIDIDSPDVTVPRRAADFHLLFGGANDLIFLENVQQEEVTRRLVAAVDGEESLSLLLITLDPELSHEVRREAAVELDELLAKDAVREQLDRIMLAQPLPPSADATGALEAYREADAEQARRFVEDLLRLQPAVIQVRSAWEAIPQSLFDAQEEDSRSHFHTVAVHQGLFRDCVLSLSETGNADRLLFDGLQNPEVTSIRNHREVLRAWAEPFRSAEPEDPPHITPESGFEQPATPRPALKSRRLSMDREKIKETVERQKDAIVLAMKRGNLHLVPRYVDDLVEYHREHGGFEYACKSLCDLATRAQDLGMHDLQLKLTQRSVDLKPDDGWAWTQHGKALQNVGEFEKSLAAYEEAELFGEERCAKNGRAETLRSMGRFEDALAAYDATCHDFPDDVFAKNGLAETLRSMGKLEDALAAYEGVCREHPENVFAKTGRAETLRSLGRLDDALEAYEAIGCEHPQNVVAKNGRAETLRSMGRLDDALEAYEAVCREDPQNSFARNGRACLLAAMDRPEEAMTELPASAPLTLQDWIGYHIRGMILLRMDNLDEAIGIFEEGVRSNPFLADRDYFCTALAVARLRQEQYEAASKALADVVAPRFQTIADLLRVHALGGMGKREEANRAFERLPDKTTPLIGEVRDELRCRYIDLLGAGHSDEWVIQRETDCVLLAL